MTDIEFVFSSWWGHATLLMNSNALAVLLQAHSFVKSGPGLRARMSIFRLYPRMIAPHE